jgi:23S rRNA (uracil1939-C5)-methyltransferase
VEKKAAGAFQCAAAELVLSDLGYEFCTLFLTNSVRLKIEKLVYGGDGLTRTDQGVVFVPRTAAGDVVEAEIIERKKDYATARVKQVLESSPDRQEPYCPNYETEGCCHWQHIRYEKQVDYKEAIVRESLRRQGKLNWEHEIKRITGPDRNYRLRATFHVMNGRLGFVNGPIRECASLVPELNQFIPTVNAPDAQAVHLLSGPAVVASFVMNNGLIQRSGRATIHVNGLRYRVAADIFFQANRFLLAPFINEVLDQSGPAPQHVLELYCGAGFFSIPLARVAKEVIAIESNRSAVRQAKENATLNEIHQLRLVEGDVDAILHRAELQPYVVVLDPPRAGCSVKTAERIARLRPQRIVYISCNPATFAREANILTSHNYMLRRLTLVDQFPNTYHIESVALFEVR